MLVDIGDLRAKSKYWDTLDRTTYDDNIIETVKSHFGLHQLIHDPTHILEKSSYIDLIFPFQLNMVKTQVPILLFTLITTTKLYLEDLI